MKIKLAELAELCLAELYDFAQAEGQYKSLHIDDIIRKFGSPDLTTCEKVIQHLQSQGCIAVSVDAWNTLGQLQITPFGITMVESGGSTGVIEKYRQNPSQFLRSQSKASL